MLQPSNMKIRFTLICRPFVDHLIVGIFENLQVGNHLGIIEG